MSIFKECDIRGVVGSELNGSDAYNVGRAIGTLIGAADIVVAGDVRLSTPMLKKRATEGLVNAGASVIDAGMLPTPAVYYAKRRFGVYACLQVTASHNPADCNGFKFMLGENPVLPGDISKVEHIIKNNAFLRISGSYCQADGVLADYADNLMGLVGQNRCKVVVDAGGGCGSVTAPQLFERCGAQTVRLFCEYDGSFSDRDPNPSVPENLVKLCKAVVETGADFGCALDGDADRVVFVDERGRVLTGEQSLCVFIKSYLKEPEQSVVYDLKSSCIVRDTILACGGVPIPERSGHAFIKRTFMARDAVLAGEISGHFFFREVQGDDGIFAALRLAQIITESGQKLSELAPEITTALTPDIRVPVDYDRRDELLQRVSEYACDYDVTSADGVRVEYPDGSWLLVRKSVTEQSVTVRIEAVDERRLAEIKKELGDNIPELRV